MHIYYPPSLSTPCLFLLLFEIVILLISPSHGRVFGSACEKNTDCKDTKWCNQETKMCDCLELKFPGVSTIQVFHSVKRACFSPEGSLCFLQKRDIFQLNCVPHAECHRAPQVDHLSAHFGLCTCSPGYVRDEIHLCEEEEEKKVVDLELGNIFSSRFNGRVGLPAEAEGNPVPPRAEKVKDDQENENRKFWISEAKRNKIIKSDSSSGRVALSGVNFAIFTTLGILWRLNFCRIF